RPGSGGGRAARTLWIPSSRDGAGPSAGARAPMSKPSCGGFLAQPDFWREEGDAPILKFNANDWLQSHVDEAIGHAHGWLASMGVEASRLAEYDTTPLSSEGARIFRADANRTFR
ncbi:unnamed protein product, partial [Prorocentrum cordatum]